MSLTGKQLKSRITMSPSGHGHYKITTTHRGKVISCVTNNMPAVDRAKDDLGEMDRDLVYPTPKQALLSLHEECKRENGLDNSVGYLIVKPVIK